MFICNRICVYVYHFRSLKMVSYPSLQNISYVEEGVTECEVSGMLMSQLPPRVADLVTCYPTCIQSQKQSEMRQAGHKTDTASLFLPREGGGHVSNMASEGSVASIISVLVQGGLTGILNNISTVVEQGILNKLWQLVATVQSSIYPHLKLSTTDLISEHVSTRGWSGSHIRCIAWHPHVAKIAVAYHDDSVSVFSVDKNVTQPVLKHAAMKNIASMAWRPLNTCHLAVACGNGVAVWTVDPSSLVSRPSSSCLVKLVRPGHSPVTDVAWSPDGKLLASGSPADTRIHVWCVETATCDTVSRSGGGGATCIKWSQDSMKLFCATPGIVFRVWNTDTWTCDRWTVGGGVGRVAAASWAPDGCHLLFATTEEPVLYCVSFLGEGESAIPLMDLSKVCLDNGDVGGGLVQDIQWDPTGHRVAVSFKDTNSVCLLRSKPGQARLSPVGWVTSSSSHFPVCIQFQQSPVEYGAVLTVAWSSDRVQHLPLVFNVQDDILSEVTDNPVQELFTSF